MNSMFKPSDLLSMAERGVLEYEGINISEIVVKAVYWASGVVDQMIEEKLEAEYDRGVEDGRDELSAEIRAVLD